MSEALKDKAATAVLERLEAMPGKFVLGVGAGSTVALFIERLPALRHKIEAAVAACEATANALKKHKLPVASLTSVDGVDVAVDGADEVNPRRELIKGRGGAHVREKILAMAANRFWVMAEDAKFHPALGQAPVPVEVIPMARSLVAREILRLGGKPQYRAGFVTDNGGVILDVQGLDLTEPVLVENKLKSFIGVIDSGIFARRRPDWVVLAGEEKVEHLGSPEA